MYCIIRIQTIDLNIVDRFDITFVSMMRIYLQLTAIMSMHIDISCTSEISQCYYILADCDACLYMADD